MVSLSEIKTYHFRGFATGVLKGDPDETEGFAGATIPMLQIADRCGAADPIYPRELAVFLIEAQAEDRPENLSQAYATAIDAGRRRHGHISNSLRRMPDTLKSLDGM